MTEVIERNGVSRELYETYKPHLMQRALLPEPHSCNTYVLKGLKALSKWNNLEVDRNIATEYWTVRQRRHYNKGTVSTHILAGALNTPEMCAWVLAYDAANTLNNRGTDDGKATEGEAAAEGE